MESSTEQHATLIELRRRRVEVLDTMRALERALASSPADPGPWAERVRAALLELSAALRVHMAITEGPDGLHAQVTLHAPRLVGPAEQLALEHIAITRQLEQSLRAVDRSDRPVDTELVGRLASQLLHTLVHHRARDAEIIHEAYDYDVGGEN